jgi:hypothetical protein
MNCPASFKFESRHFFWQKKPMRFRLAIFVLCLAALPALIFGCRKTETSAPHPSPTTLSPDTVVSVHWMGQRRLELEAGAFFFCRVWSLPETVRLQAQTFDRLATNAWKLVLPAETGAQIPAAVLRPLFNDLVKEETFLEIRAPAGVSPSVILAIHLHSQRRAGIWETNLAISAKLFSGVAVVPDSNIQGWQLQRTNSPEKISYSRVGDWSVLSAGPMQNALAGEIIARIRSQGVPFVSAGTNLWLEASLNLPRLAACFPAFNPRFPGAPNADKGGSIFDLPSSLSNSVRHVSLSLSGDGANVMAQAKFDFAKPLPPVAEPWQVPRSLLHQPLMGFTAARGVRPWISDWKAWRELQIGAPPDQLFLWSIAGSPYQTYLAAPFSDAAGKVADLTSQALQQWNPWLAAHGYISFERAPDANGIVWGNLADIKPFIKSAVDGSNSWLMAGFFPDPGPGTNQTSAGFIFDALRATNLLYYDWELTGKQLQPRLDLTQTTRLILREAQMPVDCAGIIWLAAMVPRLGVSTTTVEATAQDQLTFRRRATIGFTSLELHLLTDWLESPQFPRGLHSTSGSQP